MIRWNNWFLTLQMLHAEWLRDRSRFHAQEINEMIHHWMTDEKDRFFAAHWTPVQSQCWTSLDILEFSNLSLPCVSTRIARCFWDFMFPDKCFQVYTVYVYINNNMSILSTDVYRVHYIHIHSQSFTCLSLHRCTGCTVLSLIAVMNWPIRSQICTTLTYKAEACFGFCEWSLLRRKTFMLRWRRSRV